MKRQKGRKEGRSQLLEDEEGIKRREMKVHKKKKDVGVRGEEKRLK